MKKLIAPTLLLITALAFAAPCDGHKAGHGESCSQACDSNGDGQVTKAEMLAKAEAHFNKMDQNGDGVLTEDERLETHHQMLQHKMMLHIGMKLVHKADTDQSGDVTRDEWDLMVAELESDENGNLILFRPQGDGHHGHAAKRTPPTDLFDIDKSGMVDAADLGMIFEKVDTDGDGVMAKSELEAVHGGAKMRKAHPGAAHLQHMSMLDANGDGAIRLEDITTWFRKLDTNQNGTLEHDELKALHGKHK